MVFTEEDIYKLHKIYRINLINSASGYKSANLIGTTSKEGITNAAVFSSVTHLGSTPPTLGFILRPTTVPRNTYQNIKETGVFTVNHIHKSIIEDAHHTSAKYPEDISEFDKTNLVEEYKGQSKAPFVKGCPIQMAMRFVEEVYIAANDVKMIVGRIEELYIDDDLLLEDGFIDLSKGEVVSIIGLDGYALPKLEERFTYQRPKKEE